MHHFTYYICYRAHSKMNATNVLHVWLVQHSKSIHLESSQWFVVSSLTAAQLRDELLALIHAEDLLLLFAVGPDWSSWNLPSSVTQWLQDNWSPGLPVVR